MKYYKSIFLLLISSFFLAGSVKQNRNQKSLRENNWNDGVGNLPVGLLPTYEVRLTYTGYVSFFGDASDCHINPNGKVVLTGKLAGVENVKFGDDVAYSGILQLDINIDICSAKRLPNGEDKLCDITVSGSGPVKTELQIYFDGRGGYIQIEDTTSRGFRKNVGGSCDQAQIAEEQTMVPLKYAANVFNGLELPMLTHSTLQVGRDSSQMAEGKVVVEVLRKVN